MMSNYDIVCIGPHSWSNGIGGQIWRRRHHLMTNLAKKHRVLFIETAYFSPVRFLESVFNVSAVVSPVKKVRANLWILTLYSPLPFQETALRRGIETIKRINDKACLYQIKKALKDIGFKSNFLLWAYYTPRTTYLLDNFKSNFTVCDVYDKYTEYSTTDGWSKDYIPAQEKIIFKKSDIVFTASQPLLDYSRRYNSNCYLIPNGVDEIFCATDMNTTDVPNDLKSVPSPRIGYVGSIFDKLDYELLLNVIKSCENYSFVFIGPVRIVINHKQRQYGELTKLSNAFFLGPKSLKELPGYYKGLDVCIAPYDISFEQLNWADVYVCKMWEYLAVGKPIVITINRDIDPRLRPSIAIANNYTDFIGAINRAVKEGGNIDKKLNVRLAEDNTWPKRVDEMEKIIAQHLKE